MQFSMDKILNVNISILRILVLVFYSMEEDKKFYPAGKEEERHKRRREYSIIKSLRQALRLPPYLYEGLSEGKDKIIRE